MYLKPNILLIAPGKKGRGGVVSMVSTLYTSTFLNAKYNFKWFETQNDRGIIKNLFSLIRALIIFPFIVFNIDLVHIHTASYNSFRRKSLFMLWCILLRKKYIVHIHGGGVATFFNHSSLLARQYYIFCLNHASYIVTLAKIFSDVITKYVKNVPQVEISNPGRIELQKKSINPHVKLVLFAGLIGYEKGVFDLLHAFANLKLSNDIKLAIVGKGKIEEASNLADELCIKDRIMLPGWQTLDQLQKWYKKSDLFVLPSYIEGMPMVLLEAMAYGIPIISTTAGGIPATLPKEAHKYLFKAGDVNQLQELLLDLINNYNNRLQYSNLLQDYYANNFTEDIIFEKIDNLYSRNLLKFR